jgi:hypothetical protein
MWLVALQRHFCEVCLVVWIIAIVVVIFFLVETNMSATGPGSGNSFIDALANAIANAEGSDPSINNPGDLTAGDVPGSNITGTFNSAGVVIIDTLQNGWNALYTKLQSIMSGNSTVYSPDMTISELAQTYTGGDNADSWASSVAQSLGVSTDTTLSDAASDYQ